MICAAAFLTTHRTIKNLAPGLPDKGALQV